MSLFKQPGLKYVPPFDLSIPRNLPARREAFVRKAPRSLSRETLIKLSIAELLDEVYRRRRVDPLTQELAIRLEMLTCSDTVTQES